MSNLGKNRLDRRGPDKRFRVRVRLLEIGVDGGDQIVHAVEHAAPNPLRCEVAKPAFDEIQPRGTRRREVQDKARMRGQPRGHVRVRVRPVVIQDEMERQVPRELAVEPPQEPQEFAVRVARETLADDFPFEHMQRGKERRRNTGRRDRLGRRRRCHRDTVWN